MPKDRDQLTPELPEDAARLHPRRSADREAHAALDPSTGPGPASHGADPPARDEVGGSEKDDYQ